MSEIYAESIATNRYAPQGAERIELYGYNGLSGLTISQLVNAITVRRCAIVERQSVVFMNLIAVDADAIEQLTEGAAWVLASTSRDWSTDSVGKAYYEQLDELMNGDVVPYTTIPNDLSTQANRDEALELIQRAHKKPGNKKNQAALEEAMAWVETTTTTDWAGDPEGARYYRLLDRIINAKTEKTEIPKDISDYDNRMQVFEYFKNQIDNRNSAVDRTAVDLQTAVSRRDMLYNISTTICSRSFGALGDMAVKMN